MELITRPEKITRQAEYRTPPPRYIHRKRPKGRFLIGGIEHEKAGDRLRGRLPQAVVTGTVENQVITDLTIDSRTAGPGSLFICLKGVHTNGHAYIGKAGAQGAAAILVEEDVPTVPGVVLIRVKDTTAAMTALAPWFYDYPAEKMRVIGVTGTNGKTTTTTILRNLLTRCGRKVGLIGTISIMIGEESEVSHNTTPDVVDLQRTLYRMEQAGCDYVVMEVSSHALALNRVAGIEYDTAVLTNITQDHLDFP